MKLLILGGYGAFGGRLAQLLADCADVEMLIAGRSAGKAAAFCKAFADAASVTPLTLDRADITAALYEQKPDIVIDASGPFQDYGADPYAVVRACLATRTNYLDFADAADFVFGISQFDADAKEAGIFVLSGVSSFPVLTAAVLREFEKTMTIETVSGGIAPSPYAGIGLNVMRAVVGYAGGPVKLWRNGRTHVARGLAESRRYTIAPPGLLPLCNRRFSLVDVPDLQVLPPEHPTLREIWMGAGPVPESLHRLLNLLAKSRGHLNLPSFAVLSPLFYRVLNLMKFGEHRGGMFVHATGAQNGAAFEQSWHLLAEGDDGPFIPSMAIEAIVRAALAGDMPEPGARPATHALTLADYDRMFARRAIYTGIRSSADKNGALYRRILGSAFDDLPESLCRLHSGTETGTWSGTADVTRGKSVLARLAAAIIGFPTEGRQVPVTVTIAAQGHREFWTRNFNGRRFSSVQTAGKGRNTDLIVERFGLVSVALALVVEGHRLHLIPRRWSILGIPMPKWLLPRGTAFETETDGAFGFDVDIRTPLTGRIVHYRGHLAPAAATAS